MNYRFLIALCLSILSVGTFAQTLKTGYFLKGNLYRYRLNPAFMNDKNYVSIPVLGNINISSTGNVGLATFVHELPGTDELTTFMNSSVNANDFLGDLSDNNRINLNVDITMLSAGFKAFGGYNTIDMGLHSKTGMNLPYNMLKFMKVMGDDNYIIEDVSSQTRNYVDLAFGHSRKINDLLTVGAKVKALFGLGYGDVHFDKMNIFASGEKWEIEASGESNIALGGRYTQSDELTSTGKTRVDGYDDVSLGLHGFGMGIDLGATYDLSEALTDGLTVSLSLNDLGFISWKKTALASVSPEDRYVFDGFKEIGIHGGGQNKPLEDQFDDLKDDLQDFFNLEDKGTVSKTTGIGATLNFGAEYVMPFYDKLTVGGLFTHCFDDVYSWTQGSLMVNIAPISWFEAALSTSVSTYGVGFGALANINLTGFNFFVGTDCFLGKVNSQFIPLNNMNASVSFGFNIPF